MTTTALQNGTGEKAYGWGDDPFDPPGLDEAVESMHRSQRRVAIAFADIRPTLGGAADARLGGNDYRVMLLALERITEYRFASFGRGELAELMDVQPSVVTRSIRRLKSAGIIKPSSDTANIYFAVDSDLDY